MISNGSELLLLVPKLAGMIGSVVLPFLGSVPDCAISMHRPQLESFYVHSCIFWSWRHRVCSNSDFYWYRCTCRLYRHAVDHSMGPQVHFWLLMNHVHIVLSVVVWISMKMEKETMRSLRELPLYFFSLPTPSISNRLGQNYPIFIPGLWQKLVLKSTRELLSMQFS